MDTTYTNSAINDLSAPDSVEGTANEGERSTAVKETKKRKLEVVLDGEVDEVNNKKIRVVTGIEKKLVKVARLPNNEKSTEEDAAEQLTETTASNALKTSARLSSPTTANIEIILTEPAKVSKTLVVAENTAQRSVLNAKPSFKLPVTKSSASTTTIKRISKPKQAPAPQLFWLPGVFSAIKPKAQPIKTHNPSYTEFMDSQRAKAPSARDTTQTKTIPGLSSHSYLPTPATVVTKTLSSSKDNAKRAPVAPAKSNTRITKPIAKKAPVVQPKAIKPMQKEREGNREPILAKRLEAKSTVHPPSRPGLELGVPVAPIQWLDFSDSEEEVATGNGKTAAPAWRARGSLHIRIPRRRKKAVNVAQTA